MSQAYQEHRGAPKPMVSFWLGARWTLVAPGHCPPCPLACYAPDKCGVESQWFYHTSPTKYIFPRLGQMIARHQNVASGKSVRSWCDGSSDRSFMVDPLSYFSFQPVLHDWCHKGRGMCYPVCGIMHIKEPLVLIGKSSLYGGSRCPLSLSEWSFTIICLTPYNRK